MTEPVAGIPASRSVRPLPARGGSALGRLRRRLEALVHPLRRTIAMRQLRTPRPGRVLFLCHGNICRSPLAEALFRRETDRACAGIFEAASAGFLGADRRAPAEGIAAAAKLGIDLTPHRSQLVTADAVRGSALVVVMSSQQASAVRSRFGHSNPMVLVLGDLDPLPIDARTIRDPWHSSAEVFDDSYARIDRCVGALVRVMTGSL